MARYCSFEARKVIDTIEQYGITVDGNEYFRIEAMVGTFWNTHVIKVIGQIMKGGNPDKKIAKAESIGFSYFEKPLISMLTPRGGASRATPIEVKGDWTEQVYNLVTANLLLADFNMTELALLVEGIPRMMTEVADLSRAMAACRERNIRSIYYLHGVVQKEYATAQGRIREIQEKPEDLGWQPDADFEKMDPVERIELLGDWRSKLEDIEITKALNSV